MRKSMRAETKLTLYASIAVSPTRTPLLSSGENEEVPDDHNQTPAHESAQRTQIVEPTVFPDFEWNRRECRKTCSSLGPVAPRCWWAEAFHCEYLALTHDRPFPQLLPPPPAPDPRARLML